MSLEHDDDILDLEDFEDDDDLRLDNLDDLEYTKSMEGVILSHNPDCEMEDDDVLPGQLKLFGEDDDNED